MPLRFDTGVVRNVDRRDDGAIVADAVVTRTGVFVYRNADGTERRELRHPNHVFKLDSLSSMKLIPVTNGHPTEFVNPENVKKFKVGHTGENIRPDGSNIKATLVIDAKDGISAVDAGRRELSLGYSTDLVREDGEYHGERYDFIQTNVKYNHLALVEEARAGHVASLHLDAADAVEIDSIDEKPNNQPKPRSKVMPHLVLDGISYEASQEVINAHAKEKARADKAESELKTAQDTATKVTAERDDLKDKLEKAEKIDHTEEINKRVDARVALLGVANKVLDDEAKKNLDGMSDADIRKAVIVARASNKDETEKVLDGKDDAYIAARFDAAIEGLDKETKKDGTADQRRPSTSRHDNKDSDESPADKSREDMVERMTHPERFDEKGVRKEAK